MVILAYTCAKIYNFDSNSKALKTLAIYSEAKCELLAQKLKAGKVSGCGPCVPDLTEQDIENTPCIVGQIGPEPILQIMRAHPDFDIIIAGRAYDPSPYVAFCALNALHQSSNGFSDLESSVLGGFTHMGKLMECGGSCATPKGASSMATIYRDGSFDIRPLAGESRCTPTSVAAHALYEKARPDLLYGPGGYLNLGPARYTPLQDGVSVRACGSIFKSSRSEGLPYTIKFEGAKVLGYRSIFMGSFCDPILIQQLPSLLDRAKAYVSQQQGHVKEKWTLDFHIYGFDSEMNKKSSSSDVFIVGEALAESQTLATSVASSARIACVHGPYKGQKATGGNFGMGIGGKLEIEMGPCAEFSIYHLVELDEGEETPMEISQQVDELANQIESVPERFTRWEMQIIGTGSRVDRTKLPSFQPKSNIGRSQVAGQAIAESTDEAISPIVNPSTLGNIAKVIRSKNAGPFEITLDVMFDSVAVYEKIKELNILTPQKIAELYDIAIEDIVWCGFFDPAMAFKVTIPRYRDGKKQSSGGFMENDVHGSQKYLPLFHLQVDFFESDPTFVY